MCSTVRTFPRSPAAQVWVGTCEQSGWMEDRVKTVEGMAGLRKSWRRYARRISSIRIHLWVWPVVMVTAARRDERQTVAVCFCAVVGELGSAPGRSS